MHRTLAVRRLGAGVWALASLAWIATVASPHNSTVLAAVFVTLVALCLHLIESVV
jgi:hypothetical protein